MACVPLHGSARGPYQSIHDSTIHTHIILNRWDYAIPKYTQGALALQHLQKEGLIRHVGLTNFDLARTKELIAAGIKVAAHQVQLSLLDDRPVRAGLVAHAQEYVELRVGCLV